MKIFRKHLYLSAALFLLAACKNDLITPKTVTKVTADFSRYIAVGNSLTSGYSNGGLYRDGQMNSYPSIIAQQMQAVGGGTFAQPLFSVSQANGSGYIKLTGFNADGTPILTPVTTNLAIRGTAPIPGGGNVTLYTKYVGDNNNYGVPGIKLANLTDASYGNLNGYFERLLPAIAPANNTAYLDYITAKPFTFFTNWLGNNDALSYAATGGAGDVLTDKATYAQLYQLLMDKLTAGGQKGVVATIADVTAIPYFNTTTVAAIMANVRKTNKTVPGVYINALTNTGTYATRLATSADLILLSFNVGKIGQPVSTPQGSLPYGLTPYTPVENQYVLDQNEVAATEDYIVSYNASIKSIAAAKGIAVFDAYTFFNGIKQNGIVADQLTLNSTYITGGLFSLDGVHLTPRGFALVADGFIEAINSAYGSSIPLASVSQYSAVQIP